MTAKGEVVVRVLSLHGRECAVSSLGEGSWARGAATPRPQSSSEKTRVCEGSQVPEGGCGRCPDAAAHTTPPTDTTPLCGRGPNQAIAPSQEPKTRRQTILSAAPHPVSGAENKDKEIRARSGQGGTGQGRLCTGSPGLTLASVL